MIGSSTVNLYECLTFEIVVWICGQDFFSLANQATKKGIFCWKFEEFGSFAFLYVRYY